MFPCYVPTKSKASRRPPLYESKTKKKDASAGSRKGSKSFCSGSRNNTEIVYLSNDTKGPLHISGEDVVLAPDLRVKVELGLVHNPSTRKKRADTGKKLPVQIVRICKGKPLCNIYNEEMACALTLAVTLVNWKLFGCVFNLDANKVSRPKELLRSAQHIHGLTPLGGKLLNAPAGKCIDIHQLTLVVVLHVDGDKIPFASDEKNYILVSKDASYSKSIAKMIEKSLSVLREKCAECPEIRDHRLFMSLVEKEVSYHW
jgi:hypothetical protein